MRSTAASDGASATVFAPSEDSGARLRLLSAGLALLRIYLGLVLFSNGASKLFGLKHLHPLPGFLIDYDGARNIIQANTAHHPIGPYKDLVDFMVRHWSLFGHLVGLGEFSVGLALILGILTPIAALAAFGMLFHIWFSRWGQGDSEFVWSYWAEFVPCLVLALTSAGRFYGLDGALVARFAMLRRWPLT